jgi:truncated hemoglobin YjbI
MGFFEEIGGFDTLRKVNKIFYDKIYKHPWIGLYFKHVPQQHIENKQTDFMAGVLGGPQVYSGRFIADAHPHMMITDELFDLRHQLLQEAFKEANAPAALIEKWNAVDNAFRKKLVKKSVSDLKPRYNTDQFLNFPNPNAIPFKKAA